MDIAVAAIAYGRESWLAGKIGSDAQSPLAWRRRRGLTLSGFTTGAALPVEGTHPEGPHSSAEEDRRSIAARRRARDAIARYWWREFVATSNPDQAFAAWTLFRRSADRRALAWLRHEEWPDPSRDELSRRKVAQMDLNFRAIRKAADDQEKNGSMHFLNLRITDSIAPWYGS
jgi:hypothetical protein